MSLAQRWKSEDDLITDITTPRSKTKGDGAVQYEPFQDDGGTVEITNWPDKKPAPTTVSKWDAKTSAPTGTVQGDTDTTKG